MRPVLFSAVASVLMVLAANPAQANNIVNGDFETGTLNSAPPSPWISLGSVAEVGPVGTISPYAGSRQAVLRTASAATLSQIATFLGISSTTIDNLFPSQTAVNGSALKQTIISVTAGDVLTFHWNFNTEEALPPNTVGDDFAFFTSVINTNGLVDVLNINAKPTGWQTATYQFQTSGNFTIGVGVMNQNNTSNGSQLYVDAFDIQPGTLTPATTGGDPVPEPATMSLLAVGAFGMIGYRARRRKPATA